MKRLNIYCDESGHLERDEVSVMGGAVAASVNYKLSPDNMLAARMAYRKRRLVHKCVQKDQRS